MCLFEDGIGAATAATVASAELDGKYKRLRRLGAKLAHKAQWHNERNAPIYVSADFPSCERCAILQRIGASLSNRGKPEGKG